jgi:selenocysteine lyase/cysteine desulfurase
VELKRREFLGGVPAGVGLATAAAAVTADGTPRADAGDDPLGVRADFPVTREGIYLNSAYITPSPLSVAEAAGEFHRAKTIRPISLDRMLATTDEARNQMARLFGAFAEEVGFLFSTSEGENVVSAAIDWNPGDNVVVDDLHYNTTYALYRHLEKTRGLELRIVPHTEGAAEAAAFARVVDRKTRLVSVAWVSHQNGYRHDLRALADLAHANGAFLYVDGIQALGMFPTDLHAEGVDFVTSGTYKWLLGGFGVAPFYVRREHLDRIPPDRQGALNIEKDLGNRRYQVYGTARKYEYATLAFGAVVQLGAGLTFLERVGLGRIEAHTVALARALQSGLRGLGLRVLTPEGNASSILAFASPRPQPEVARALEGAGVQVSFREKGTQIRVAPALFNNAAEVKGLLEVMAGLV